MFKIFKAIRNFFGGLSLLRAEVESLRLQLDAERLRTTKLEFSIAALERRTTAHAEQIVTLNFLKGVGGDVQTMMRLFKLNRDNTEEKITQLEQGLTMLMRVQEQAAATTVSQVDMIARLTTAVRDLKGLPPEVSPTTH